MTTEDKLKATFLETLAISDTTDFANLSYRSVAQWDSVAHMQLVNALETRFGVMLDTEDVLAMSSFSKAKEILRRYGVEV